MFYYPGIESSFYYERTRWPRNSLLRWILMLYYSPTRCDWARKPRSRLVLFPSQNQPKQSNESSVKATIRLDTRARIEFHECLCLATSHRQDLRQSILRRVHIQMSHDLQRVPDCEQSAK